MVKKHLIKHGLWGFKYIIFSFTFLSTLQFLLFRLNYFPWKENAMFIWQNLLCIGGAGSSGTPSNLTRAKEQDKACRKLSCLPFVFVPFEKYNWGPWTSSEWMTSYCNNTKSYDKSHHINRKRWILESIWPAIRILFNSNICLYKERLGRRLYVRLGNAIKYVCFFLKNHVLNNLLHQKEIKKDLEEDL